MRTVIILAMSAGMAWAQQPPASTDQILKQVWADMAAQIQQSTNRQLALADLQAMQAALAALKAEQKADIVQLSDLRTRLSETHPDIVALRQKVDSLQKQIEQQQKLINSTFGYEIPVRFFDRSPGGAFGAYALPIPLRASVRQSAGDVPKLDAPKIVLPDRWWKNPATAQYVGLTADQQRKMDDVFQQYRARLMVLNTDLEREESTMEPLVSGGPLDEAKITAQIDRVAQARAELEKANGRMLLGIRKLLAPEQWAKLNQGFSLASTQK